ncbi:MAG TPA: ribosome biogenesis GTPase Der [Candidatus Hydrogenedentes bacterium]|nr:ribosome biogenesis GTPase Der [Candidatus Hydrogenedentota bacterium]
MASRKKLPLVAICGRPNVGKSTLFNRLTGRQSAIVHSLEGITRDRAYGVAEWNDYAFRLVDTGGIVHNPTDPITHKMQEQVRAALNEARVVVFVLDGQQEITRTDEEIRDELFKLGKPVVLAVNKLDNDRLAKNQTDFYALGLGDPHAISSGHGLGIDDLFAAIAEHLPAPVPQDEEEEADADAPDVPEVLAEEALSEGGPIKVAIIGKPNVGKSSFINAILNEERTIVTDIPGTTRDAIDIDFRWKDREYILIDTAGLRRKAGIKEHVEHFSVARTLRAIRRADVCLVMIDAVEGISEQDKRIVGYVQENGKAMVLAWTKWDLVEDKEARFKSLADEIDLKVPFLKYVTYLTVSNLTRQRLFTAFDYIDKTAAEARKRISTPALNRFLQDLRGQGAGSHRKGVEAKIRYGTQVGVNPTTFILFVNSKKLFHFSHMRFIENRLREKFGFQGVPVTIELREGEPRK